MITSLDASAVLVSPVRIVVAIWPPARNDCISGSMHGAANLAVCMGPLIVEWTALVSWGFQWVIFDADKIKYLTVFLVGAPSPENTRSVVGKMKGEGKGRRGTGEK